MQHLVSRLRARLRSDLDRFDAFGSCFPAGTVTGAPKVRAMEIISQLEPDPRGIYAGAMVYADYSQNLDSCIAIRTIVLEDGKASVQAGAGIVADSVPEYEYEETLNKAKALFQRSRCRKRNATINAGLERVGRGLTRICANMKSMNWYVRAVQKKPGWPRDERLDLNYPNALFLICVYPRRSAANFRTGFQHDSRHR